MGVDQNQNWVFGCCDTFRVIFCRRASTLGVYSIMFRELQLASSVRGTMMITNLMTPGLLDRCLLEG